MRRLLAIGFITVAALFHPSAASADPTRITVGAPATVEIARSPEAQKRTTGSEHVVVTVSGYEPSPSGPVQIVAAAVCNGHERAIGRFAVLPAIGFTPADTARRQHFGLTLPHDCGRPTQLVLHLIPSHGDGKGAHADIASAEIK